MDKAPPPYTPGNYGSQTPTHPTNPNYNLNQPYYPPTNPIQPPTQAAFPANQPPPQGPYQQTQLPYPVQQAPYPVAQGSYLLGQPPPPPPPITHQLSRVPATTVRRVQCPSCGVGTIRKYVTCCGVFCAFFFFPCGLICLFTMMESRCTSCRTKF